MTSLAPVMGFVLLGMGSMIFLTGVPRPDRLPEIGFQQVTEVGARLTCAACGAAPILMLSTAYAGFAPLRTLLVFVVIPAYAVIAILALLLPSVGRGVVTGFLGGIVAVLAYDLMRLALSYSQGGGDPIPHIGTMIMGTDAPWWVGYLWRTLGNGAGMGVIYGVLCPRSWWGPKTGLVYASCIGLGMLGFLTLFPQAQSQLFPVSWQTMVNSSLGHATYGLVLGAMARAYARKVAARPPVTRGRHARRSGPDVPSEAVTRRMPRV